MAEKADRTDDNSNLASDSGFVQHFPTEVEEPAGRLAELAVEIAAAAERAASAERTAAEERAIEQAVGWEAYRARNRAAESTEEAEKAAEKAAERAVRAEREVRAERVAERTAELAAERLAAAEERVAAAERAAAETERVAAAETERVAAAETEIERAAAETEIERAAAETEIERAETETEIEIAETETEIEIAAAETERAAAETERAAAERAAEKVLYKAFAIAAIRKASADGLLVSEIARALEAERAAERASLLSYIGEEPKGTVASFLTAIEEILKIDARTDILAAQQLVAAGETTKISSLLVAAESSARAVTREPSAIGRLTAAATASAVARLEAGAPASEVAAATSAATTAEIARLVAGYLDQGEHLAATLAAAGGPSTVNFLRVIMASLEVAVKCMEDLATIQERTVRDLESVRPTSAQVSTPRTVSEIPQRIETERGASEGSSHESGSQAKRRKSVIPPKESGTVAESSVAEDSCATISPQEAAAKSSATKDSSFERLPKK